MEYLIRFLEKSDYVWQLLYGQLNMFPAAYYILTREQGRGDMREASISKKAWMDIQVPIYCMSYAEGNSDGIIRIDRRAIRDFCKCGGYAVIFDKTTFIEAMSGLLRNDARSFHGRVIYDLSPAELPDVMPQRLPEIKSVLLRKEPNYIYQNEYRFGFPDADITYWPLEPDWFKVPWKPTIPITRDRVWVSKVPPLCEICEDTFTLSTEHCADPLRGEWLLRSRD